jgi:hypothetical protein
MGKLGSSIVGELFLVTSVMASAEPQLTQAEARCCSTIVNDEKRLSVSTIWFPPKEAVEATTGARPALPEWISDLNQRPQRMTALPAPQ